MEKLLENVKSCPVCKRYTCEGCQPTAKPADYVSQVLDPESKEFQLGILRNIEREMPRQKRKHTLNWVIVQDYLLAIRRKVAAHRVVFIAAGSA
jgi:hypothetical protein